MDSFCTLTCPSLSTGVVTEYMSLLLNFISISQCSMSSTELWPMDYGEIALRRGFQEYDFIIVGAGSAGSVLANRLSENPLWKILLLEAGGDPPMESNIPRLLSSLVKSKFDWQYVMEPSVNHSILADQPKPRGKMLGGSSSMNAMMYVRGNAEDYNNWESQGNPTWGWDSVLEYFLKSEANQNFDGYYHSRDGLLNVENFNSNDSFKFEIIKAAQELGMKFVEDINEEENVGFAFTQGTIKDGVRASTAMSFLVPIKDRPNLHVVKNAMVMNLIIDDDGEVRGVRLNLRGKRELKAYAMKEVILSAGTINTPQILMLSGIGPAKHLQELGVPLIQDLQVGKNFQDHPAVILVAKLDESSELSSTDTLNDFYTYISQKKGPLATIGVGETVGYVNVHNLHAKYPNFQFYFSLFHKGQVNEVRRHCSTVGYNDQICETFVNTAKQGRILFTSLVYLTEKSRGEILLRSPNSFDKPRIYQNFLSEQSDVEAFITAIQLNLKFLTTDTFKSHGARLIIFPIPECDAIEFNTDEYWTCYIKYMTTSFYHLVGTAKMGPSSDPNAVVDSNLRVRGIRGLRVIDASVMPTIPRAQTNAPTIMIAEKGADIIKQDWDEY